jgi:crotonobetainyl-CoA:carnitine CoA-transferase CaiB-like acyl-CoA transferase
MDAGLPLAGVKVVDFGWAVMGPFTAKYLAIFGAQVIKVESVVRPDGLRLTGPFVKREPGPDTSGPFANHNLSKLDVSLNLESPKGIHLAKRLIVWSDVVCENFSPGVMDKLGLGYQELNKIKADLILVSLSAQGQTGPMAHHSGVGNSLQALAGIDYVTGFPEGPPGGPSQMLPDFMAPWFAMVAIICGLEHRQRTGRGQHIDVNLYEALLPVMAPALLDHAVNGCLWGRQGNRAESAAPHNLYPCRPDDARPAGERWIAIACLQDTEWQALCRAMGQPELASDPRFDTLIARKAHEDELDGIVAQWTGSREARALMEELQCAGVPAGLVSDGKDLLEDPQLSARGHFYRLGHPVVGRQPFDGPSFRLSETPPQVRRAPLLGEHNEYVCKEILRLSDEEIADLMAEGVIAAF